MEENNGFNFEYIDVTVREKKTDFKKQRQLYLAERDARKREAQEQIKKDFGRDTSSEEDGPAVKKQPLLIKANINVEGSNTDSSKNSPQPEALFKQQREKYKTERLARRHEALINKKKEFGSSSSDDQSVPVHPHLRSPQMKLQKIPFKQQENNPFGFTSAESNQAKQTRNAALASVRLKQKHSEKKESRQRYEVEIPSKKGNNIWIQNWLQFKENSVEIGERSIPLYDITKVKMIILPTPSGCYKIKITVKEEEDIFLAVNCKKMNESHFLDQLYYIFAKIVTVKLQMMGRKTVTVTRVKSGVSEQVLKEARLAGRVRKSSFFGGWEQKIGVVNEKGLSIYKQGKDKANPIIAPGSIKEIWTRFQFQKENIILKFMNGSSKLQLSVPIQNWICKENWLYQIYTLTPK